MQFVANDRRDVDIVEAGYVNFKNRCQEEIDILVPHLIAKDIFEPRPLTNSNLTIIQRARAMSLCPWGYSFHISPDVSTSQLDNESLGFPISNEGTAELRIRSAMISLAMTTFAPGGEWLDIATNSGHLPLMLNNKNQYRITGIDIGSENIDKAKFLSALANNHSAEFIVADAFDYLKAQPDDRFDIVSAHGLFYHLSDPLGLASLMFTKSKRVAMIETVIHNFPFSGWFQTVSRHVKHEDLRHANDTRKIFELHPTYRGLIDTLFQVGFREVHEVLPSDAILQDNPGTIFSTRNRRLLIGIK